jgi:undecaprenyl-diphosphatase
MFDFEVTPMDHDLFAAINGLAGRLHFADLMTVALSKFGPFLLLIALGVLWFLPTQAAERDRRQRVALIAAIGTAGSLLVNQILIRVWSRPRPFAVEAARLLLPPSPDPSFPSDHATFAFAVAAGLFLVSKRLGFTALILAALIALSRVYVGEHYVSDVVGGALIGSGATFAAASARGALEPLLAGIIRVARRLHLA